MSKKPCALVGADDIQLMVQLGVPESYIEGLLYDGEFKPSGDRRTPGSQLSPSEVEILRAGGALGLGEYTGQENTNKRHLALNLIEECRALVERSYDLTSVAERFQSSPEEVRSLAGGDAPTLYAFYLAGDETLHFPRWQFAGSVTIPGLGAVLEAVGTGVRPIAFSRFMLMESKDLENEETYYSPREWLARGFDPQPVLAMARSLASV